MSDDRIKLPRSSYEELCKIAKAYGRLQKPASLDEVSHLCAMGKTVISANNAFLAIIGLIEGGKAKIATERGRSLAIALEHEIPDEIQSNWATVVRENEFLDKMASAVKIRGKMEGSALEAHIAYSAGEAKSGQVMTGARAVVDILRAAGVVREHDGQLVASGAQSTPIDAPAPKPHDLDEIRTKQSVTQVIAPRPSEYPTAVSVQVQLRIDAKPNELEGLGKRIRDMMRDLHAESDAATGSDDKNS